MVTVNLVLVNKIGDKYKKRFVKDASEVIAEMTQAEYDAIATSGQPSYPPGTDETWTWAGAWKEWEFDTPSGQFDVEGYLTEAWPGYWTIRVTSCADCQPRFKILKSAHTITGTPPDITVTPDAKPGHSVTDGVLTF